MQVSTIKLATPPVNQSSQNGSITVTFDEARKTANIIKPGSSSTTAVPVTSEASVQLQYQAKNHGTPQKVSMEGNTQQQQQQMLQPHSRSTQAHKQQRSQLTMVKLDTPN